MAIDVFPLTGLRSAPRNLLSTALHKIPQTVHSTLKTRARISVLSDRPRFCQFFPPAIRQPFCVSNCIYDVLCHWAKSGFMVLKQTRGFLLQSILHKGDLGGPGGRGV